MTFSRPYEISRFKKSVKAANQLNMRLGHLIYAVLFLFSAALPALEFSGLDLNTGKPIEFHKGERGTVVVFLSAACPCSHSHIEELKDLAREFPKFSFIGVHSNANEPKDFTLAYFERAALPFPILKDTGARLANELRANRTPHAFVISSDGKVLYKGGVSDSKDCRKAGRKYLREALSDLDQGKPVRTPETRSLGCAISRRGNHDW